MKLSDYLEDEIEIGGKKYRLNLSFDNVLMFFDLVNDKAFFDNEKVEIAFRMFVETDDNIPIEIKNETLEVIVRTFILDEDDKKDRGTGESKKLFDLTQDAKYIFASFMQEYGIDLLEEQGKLRWEKFTALLSGLRDNTKFKEIVGIRGAKLPSGKHMEEERRRLIELKEVYKLERSQDDIEKELDAMFNKLAGGI